MNWRGMGGNNWFALCGDDGCGVVAVCFEGGCGSMCWPVDRPATHAAAGAAARGALIFCFGGLFHTLGSGWHERVRGGGFNPLRGATTGVVMRRRATSGEMARGGLVFVFSLEVAPVSEGDSFTRSELGNDIGLMGALLLFVLRVVAGACVGRGSGQPRMPPRERQHEGVGFLRRRKRAGNSGMMAV